MPDTLPDEPSDEALMEGLVQQQPESLDLLYRRYSAVLKGVVMRVVHDEAESEDLLQEIFMQVWGRAENYSPEKGKPLGWLVTLARRRAIDRLRQRRAYRRATDRFEWECKLPHQAQERSGFERHVFHDDLRELLSKLIDGLPVFQRQAIMLAFFEGMSQREIAAATSIPLGTIKTRIELGMRKLAGAVLAVREKIE
ncbi:MAG: sigma-70 family RNA polymerase sigma factor [Verrucomicrobiota bacterium]